MTHKWLLRSIWSLIALTREVSIMDHARFQTVTQIHAKYGSILTKAYESGHDIQDLRSGTMKLARLTNVISLKLD